LMGWFRELLHRQPAPVVSPDEREELAALSGAVAEVRAQQERQRAEANRLGRFFERQNEVNHLAERWSTALRKGTRNA
jgi:hypothetical protein